MRTYEWDDYTGPRHTVLSAEEMAEADRVAEFRHGLGRSTGAKHRAGAGSLEYDKRGSYGELGSAKILRQPWNVPASDDFVKIRGSADVGGYEIRATKWPNGCLLIYPHDKDDSIFVLAIVEGHPLPGRLAVRVTLKGWAFAGDAKIDTYWTTKRAEYLPAWFYPQRFLQPMDTLPHREVDGETRVATLRSATP